MQFVVRWWLVAFTTLAVAQSCPLVFEEKAVTALWDVAYTELGGAVAHRLHCLSTASQLDLSGGRGTFRGLPT
jgi:hypothetical protein